MIHRRTRACVEQISLRCTQWAEGNLRKPERLHNDHGQPGKELRLGFMFKFGDNGIIRG